MELQQLRYVIAVSDTLNFTRAAERCHVVQSALSHRVAALEKELGARLFDRTNRSVRLTRAGRPSCRRPAPRSPPPNAPPTRWPPRSAASAAPSPSG